MGEGSKVNEEERRAAAQANRESEATVVRELNGRDIQQMLSVRVPAELAAELRDLAAQRQMSLSDLIRASLESTLRSARSSTTHLRTSVRPSHFSIEQRVLFGPQSGSTVVGIKLGS